MNLQQKLGQILNKNDIELQKATNGVDNEVFFILNNGVKEYVAKLYTKRDLSKVTEIGKVLDVLSENNLSVPKPVVPPFLVDDKPVILSHVLPGRHILNLSNHNLNEVAKVMALYNQIKVENISSWFPSLKESTKFLEYIQNDEVSGLVRFIATTLGDSFLNSLPQSLVHGDFSQSNLLFDTDGNISGILDVDHTCNSYRLMDLARSLVFFGFLEARLFDLDMARQFIAEYTKYNKLTEFESMKIVPMLKLLLIKMLLETFYYVHVIKEVSTDIFINSDFNQSSDTLLKKLITIKDLENI